MVLRIAVGSKNPVKVEATRRAFEAAFGAVEISAHDVPSGVRDQPWGDDETRRGAATRAVGALAAAAADYGVGLEGGVRDAASGGLDSVGCMAIVRASDRRQSVDDDLCVASHQRRRRLGQRQRDLQRPRARC